MVGIDTMTHHWSIMMDSYEQIKKKASSRQEGGNSCQPISGLTTLRRTCYKLNILKILDIPTDN